MISQTFDVEPEGANEDFQMQSIQLQSNEFYKSKLGVIGISVIEFYKKYFSESKSFPKLIDPAKKFACIFGSTYILEQLFLEMKYIILKSDQS